MTLIASLRAAADRSRASFRAAAPALLRDVAGLAGAGLIATGTGEVYPPAGLIVGGIMLLGGALLGARRI